MFYTINISSTREERICNSFLVTESIRGESNNKISSIILSHLPILKVILMGVDGGGGVPDRSTADYKHSNLPVTDFIRPEMGLQLPVFEKPNMLMQQLH